MKPRILLESVAGAEYKEMIDVRRCCGSASIYNLLESKISMQILGYKMEQTKKTEATIVVITNDHHVLWVQ